MTPEVDRGERRAPSMLPVLPDRSFRGCSRSVCCGVRKRRSASIATARLAPRTSRSCSVHGTKAGTPTSTGTGSWPVPILACCVRRGRGSNGDADSCATRMPGKGAAGDARSCPRETGPRSLPSGDSPAHGHAPQRASRTPRSALSMMPSALRSAWPDSGPKLASMMPRSAPSMVPSRLRSPRQVGE